uniref:G-protein coupled receptors family 3 profile domain-containing protein n=1 Tax=Xenopus tropicalis TaxID=8364 RepID=F6PZZ9_XENTR
MIIFVIVISMKYFINIGIGKYSYFIEKYLIFSLHFDFSKRLNPRNYQNVLAFIFAVNEINRNPHLLPNISLGFRIVDGCSCEERAVTGMFDILSGGNTPVPNFHCGFLHNLAAIVDGISSKISYSTLDPVLSDKVRFPSFYRTVPSDIMQYLAIVQLVKYFSWSWVGILVSDDESGLKMSQVLQEQLADYGICVAFLEFIPQSNFIDDDRGPQIARSINSTNVLIVYGDRSYMFSLQLILYMFPVSDKVWIISYQCDISAGSNLYFLSFAPFNGSLAFVLHKDTIPGFKEFFLGIRPDLYPQDIFISHVWMYFFDCKWAVNAEDPKKCTGKEKMNDSVPLVLSSYSYNIYNAVYALAHSLHLMYLKEPKEQMNRHHVKAWKVSCFHFIIVAEHLGVPSIHLISFYFQTPQSACSETCTTGYRKTPKAGYPACCYDCIPCPEGAISNQTDMELCFQCQENQWPNTKGNACVFKEIIYLSYGEPLGMSLALISILFFLLTSLTLLIFTIYRSTAIVKANNRDLSYLLLLSLKTCFLCNFIFMGHPIHMTCILRQTVFGVTFSISLSTILAKTVTVIIAFHATKPRTRLRTFLGPYVAYFIVIFCSLIQVLISASWLGTYPPFPQYNMVDEVGKIIAECNEGSKLGFYSVLGFMGLLACISFIIAFFARNLPDNFNEAKLITFSMLVFCSVWVSFIPAYMSTKGKYVVATEIFAIIASSMALLVCIFIPKCYIILLRPERNTKVCIRN